MPQGNVELAGGRSCPAPSAKIAPVWGKSLDAVIEAISDQQVAIGVEGDAGGTAEFTLTSSLHSPAMPTKPPSVSKMEMRLSASSDMNRLPSALMVIAEGHIIWPSATPPLPNSP